jgi:hypothetical protein
VIELFHLQAGVDSPSSASPEDFDGSFLRYFFPALGIFHQQAFVSWFAST